MDTLFIEKSRYPGCFGPHIPTREAIFIQSLPSLRFPSCTYDRFNIFQILKCFVFVVFVYFVYLVLFFLLILVAKRLYPS